MLADQDRRYVISIISSTNDGQLCRRDLRSQIERVTETIQLEFTQPKIVQEYYSVCSEIPQYNLCRQEDLNNDKELAHNHGLSG